MTKNNKTTNKKHPNKTNKDKLEILASFSEKNTPSEDNYYQNRILQYSTLGLKIALYRKQRNLTQIDLADKVNISRTYLSNIESPKTIVNPSLDVIIDISKALDVPMSKLFDINSI